MAARQPPGTSLRQRLRQWALRRQGRDTLPGALRARRIYILPTGAGVIFGVLLIVMFVAGMNYGNGLALLFTFWLTGFALVAMIRTQRLLARTRLLELSLQPGFAGGEVRVSLQVAAGSAVPDLQLTLEDTAATPLPPATSGDEGVLALRVPVQRRGRWRLPPLCLASTAPFGLFRTWTWLWIDAQTLVYPAPVGELPVPASEGAQAGAWAAPQGQDELAWLRDFRDGDSPRQVAWKAYARGAPLLVREYRGQGAERHVFDHAALAPLDGEARLSQLARWIIDTEARGQGWVLRLPGAAPLAGAGSEHRQQCLARLALHDLPGEGP